jgi:hypothetical protein
MGIFTSAGNLGKKVASAPVEQAKLIMGLEQAGKNLMWIKAMAMHLRPSAVKVGIVETFELAMERQRVSEHDLQQLFKSRVWTFWVCALMLALGIGIGANFIVDGDWVPLMPLGSYCAMVLAQMFGASFRAYQIENRRFCDVSEWFHKRDAWVPLTFALPAKPARKSSSKSGASSSALVKIEKK